MNEKSGIECHTIMEVGKVIYQLRHRDTDMWISPSCGFHSSFFPILPAEEVSNLWNPANWADFILKSQWGFRFRATSSRDRGASRGDFFIMTFSVSLTSPVMLHFSTGHPVQEPTPPCIHQLWQFPPKQVQTWMLLFHGRALPPHAYFLLHCCYPVLPSTPQNDCWQAWAAPDPQAFSLV